MLTKIKKRCIISLSKILGKNLKGCVVKMLRTSFSTKGEWDLPKKSKTRNRFCAKLISGAVSAMMVLSMVPVGMTFADNATAKLEGTTYTVSVTGDTLDKTTFAEADKNSTVTKVQFEAGSAVNTINADAFKDLTALEEIDFSGATKLKEFNLNNAAASTSTLKKVTMPSTTGLRGAACTVTSTFFNGGFDKLEEILFLANSNFTTIEANAFENLAALNRVALSNKTTKIELSAFSGCTSLSDIDISNVELIGPSAFANCSALTSITLNDKVTAIDEQTFAGCTKLESINCGKVEEIKTKAFNGCKSLNSIDCKNVKTIGQEAFSGCEALADLNIPKSVTAIDASAFNGCKALANVSFDKDSQLTEIQDSTFANCTALDNVVLPETVEKIGQNAFSHCNALKRMDLSKNNKLTTIAQQAFSTCIALKEVYIPKSTTAIETNAFEYCAELAQVAFEAGANLNIPEKAFENSDKIAEVINLPTPATENYNNKAAFPAKTKYYQTLDEKKPQTIDAKSNPIEGSWTGIIAADANLAETKLQIKEVSQNEYTENVNNIIDKYEESVVLNLSLVDNNTNPVDVKEVTVTLKFNEKLPNTIEKILHEKADGTIEELEIISKDDNSITFKTTSFSNFIFAGEEKSTPAPSQPEQGNSTSNNDTSAAKAEDNKEAVNKEAAKVAAQKGTSTSKAVKTGDNSVMVASGLAIIMLSAIGCWLFITKKVKD